MSNKIMKIDFKNDESILNFMESYFGVSIESIKNFKSNYEYFSNQMYLDFVRRFDIDCEKLCSENISIPVKHITTVIDNKASLEKYGFINLKDCIEKETPLKKFLYENGITLDIERKIICIDGIEYEIKKNDEKLSPMGQFLYTRLYEHKCEREVFIANIKRNYSVIERCPEIIETISNFYREKTKSFKSIVYNWSSIPDKKVFVLGFDINIKHLNTKINLGYLEDEYLRLWNYKYDYNSIPKQLMDSIYILKICMEVLYNEKKVICGEIYNDAVISYDDIYNFDELK